MATVGLSQNVSQDSGCRAQLHSFVDRGWSQWCCVEWSGLAGHLGEEPCAILLELAKRVALFIPLLFATLVEGICRLAEMLCSGREPGKQIYRERQAIWNLERAKASGIDDRKRPHISNIRSFTIVDSRELSRCSKSKFIAARGIPEPIAKLQSVPRCALSLPDSDFLQTAYDQKDMSVCEKQEPALKSSNLGREASFTIDSAVTVFQPAAPRVALASADPVEPPISLPVPLPVPHSVLVNPLPADFVNTQLEWDLLWAAGSGDLPEVERLLQEGANICAVDTDGRIIKRLYPEPYFIKTAGGTALYLACQNGHTSVAKALLEKARCLRISIVDIPDAGGATPLLAMTVFYEDNRKWCLKLLLENGARLDVADKRKDVGLGRTVLHNTLIDLHLENRLEAFQIILEHMPALPVFVQEIEAALDIPKELIQIVIQYCDFQKCYVNLKDDDGYTPLFFPFLIFYPVLACLGDHDKYYRAVNLLLEAGADPLSQSKDGENIAQFVRRSCSYALSSREVSQFLEFLDGVVTKAQASARPALTLQ